ncbi:MAG: hypothetical protein AAGF95_20590 [Chloroflexota bacterium]
MTEQIPFDVSYDFDEQLREVPRNPSAMQQALDWLNTRISDAELDAVQRIRYYGLIGVYARMLHQYETAIDALQIALSQAAQQQHERLVVMNQIRLAHVYQWQGRHDESDALFDQIIQTCLTNPRVADYLDFAYQHAGKNAFDQADYLTAIRYFEQALVLRKTQGNTELIESTELALSLTQQRMQKEQL